MGANVKFGIPFTEVDRVYFGVGVEQTDIDTYWNSPPQYLEFVRQFGSGNTASAWSLPLTVAWQRDSRDSSLIPTKGRFQKANAEVSLVGDMKYYKLSYQHQYFWPLFSGGTLALNGMVDYVRLGENPYLFSKTFMLAVWVGSRVRSSSLDVRIRLLRNVFISGGSKLWSQLELQFRARDWRGQNLALVCLMDANVLRDGHNINWDLSLDLFRYQLGVADRSLKSATVFC